MNGSWSWPTVGPFPSLFPTSLSLLHPYLFWSLDLTSAGLLSDGLSTWSSWGLIYTTPRPHLYIYMNEIDE